MPTGCFRPYTSELSTSRPYPCNLLIHNFEHILHLPVSENNPCDRRDDLPADTIMIEYRLMCNRFQIKKYFPRRTRGVTENAYGYFSMSLRGYQLILER